MTPDQPNPRDLPEDRLAEQCRWEAFRGPGPGGQKRNKTSNAVRVTHVPTGISATAAESRSQMRNRQLAFARLRSRLALEMRNPVASDESFPPGWFTELLSAGNRLRILPSDARYIAVVGLVFDALHIAGGAIAECGQMLGVSTAQLVDFLQRDEELLSHANSMRRSAGLKQLGGDRG